MQNLRFLPSIITALTAFTLTSCSTATAEQYEATALTSYTWQVKYANNLTSQPQPRIEIFANPSVLNRNGLKPPGAVVGPDDRGLWWPTLPPRPSVDEVEQRKRLQEEAGKPELIKDVKYKREQCENVRSGFNYQLHRHILNKTRFISLRSHPEIPISVLGFSTSQNRIAPPLHLHNLFQEALTEVNKSKPKDKGQKQPVKGFQRG